MISSKSEKKTGPVLGLFRRISFKKIEDGLKFSEKVLLLFNFGRSVENMLFKEIWGNRILDILLIYLFIYLFIYSFIFFGWGANSGIFDPKKTTKES